MLGTDRHTENMATNRKVPLEAGTNREPSIPFTLMQRLTTHIPRLGTETSCHFKNLTGRRKSGTNPCPRKNQVPPLHKTEIAI